MVCRVSEEEGGKRRRRRKKRRPLGEPQVPRLPRKFQAQSPGAQETPDDARAYIPPLAEQQAQMKTKLSCEASFKFQKLKMKTKLSCDASVKFQELKM